MVMILMGVSGSGKTAVGRKVAARLGWAFHDGDDFHPPANIAKMAAGRPLAEEDRQPWLRAMAAAIGAWLDSGADAILACSALTEGSRRILGVDRPGVRLVYLKGDYELIRSRLDARKHHFMPPDLLQSQFATLQEPRGAITMDVAQTLDEVVDQVVAAVNRGA